MEIGHEAQHAGQGAPQRRVRHAEGPEQDAGQRAEGRVHDELRQEEARHATRRVRQRAHRAADFGLAGQSDEAVAQRFVLEQDEDQQHQHQAGFADRAPGQREQARQAVAGSRTRRADFDRERLVGTGGERAAPHRDRRWRRDRRLGRNGAEFRFQAREGAFGEFAHAFDFRADSGPVGRQVARHGDQLEGQHGADADHASPCKDHRYQRRRQARQAEAAQRADQGCEHQAQDGGQRQRLEHVAPEIQQAQDAGGGDHRAGGQVTQQTRITHQ